MTVFKQVADYLNAHADRSILLTGLYSNKEQNSSILPNLGLARAQSVKEILLDLGCPKKQIGVGAAMNQLSSNQTLLGGIHYSFTDTPITK